MLDFMDHAATLYEAVAGDTVIEPVVYEGSLGRGKCEQMYGKYIGKNIMKMDDKQQERNDRLQVREEERSKKCDTRTSQPLRGYSSLQ